MPKTYELIGFDELERLLADLPDLAEAAGTRAMAATLRFLHGELPEYPPPPGPDAPSPLRSDKQRRWFFWALRNGLVTVPYRRTETLGRRNWSEVVSPIADGIEGVLGTSTPYAEYVIGREKQAEIHQGRWWTFEDVIEENLDEASQVFEEEFWGNLELT